MTAYASIKKIAEPKAGDVAFVSGAAGAVGLVAGQLLKHVYGCKVIGSAGTEDKVRLILILAQNAWAYSAAVDGSNSLQRGVPTGEVSYWSCCVAVLFVAQVALLKEVGFDYAFNYKTTETDAALAEAAPDGIDIYFDNVGGKTLEDAMTASRNHGRIVACGQISTYDAPEEKRYGVRNLFYVSRTVPGGAFHRPSKTRGMHMQPCS
jgi:NADPH-dependent curcumin reductase CurA